MMHRTVELADWATRAARIHTVASVRRNAIASVIVGALLVVLAAAGAAMVVITWSRPAMLFGVAFLGLTGALMLWSARRRLLTCKGRSREEQVTFVAPYAFLISDDTLEFPEVVGRDAESWPRATTTASVESRLGQPALKLEHPDRKPRRYFARALRESPEDVLRAL